MTVEMGRAGLIFLVCFLAACASRKEKLNLLEQEKLRFKAENEEVRMEDLQARYDEQKRKTDALSDELLALMRHRDELFDAYDALRGDVSRLERDRQAKTQQKAGLVKQVQATQAEVAKLKAQLEKERKAIAALEKELAAAGKKRAGLEAKKQVAKAPE
jgi:chromosome segregation ATPase